ncbi:hypothetical protein O181_074472 [Austropuccinia psidii MF-1]|uniref:Uncharacterized protein n=1 Tax=Austropuccinia psidii MF-1 TaxID=1389203 RepID=A0A9Q3FAZ5_9BASI|nr:hypothetical protein [Austropuccinia psidii MF-1]
MKVKAKTTLPHQLSDHLTVWTQPNDQIIDKELHFHKVSVIPHDVKPVWTQPQNHNYLKDENFPNNNHPKSRKQRRILSYMNQTAGHLGLYNPNFSILTLEKKKDYNFFWLKLPLQKLLPRPYVLINKNNNAYLPILMYQIHPFSSPTPIFHKCQELIIRLNKLANNCQNITINTEMLYGIMKGIGFCHFLDSGKSAVVYARKSGLTKETIYEDNKQWSTLQEFY